MRNDIIQNRSACLKDHLGKDILPLSALENASVPGADPVEILLYYKKETSVQTLRENLIKAIRHYNLFSSRLIVIEKNRFALQYCTDGADINVLPPLDVSFDDLDIGKIRGMMTHVKTLPGEPLLAVTGIPIRDGIVGAVSCSHAVADGVSLMLFLFTWSCLIEGNPFLPPSPQRLFTGNPLRLDDMDQAFIPPLSELDDRIRERMSRALQNDSHTIREYFPDGFFDDIKKIETGGGGNVSLSTNQTMTAHLLKKYHRNILPAARKIVVRVPVNIREIHPDIDALYIGNAYVDSIAEFSREEVDAMPMMDIARRLKDSIARTRQERFITGISFLSPYGLEFKPEALQQFPPFNPETDVVASNLTHISDLESLGLGSNIGRLIHIGGPARTSFVMLKEKSGRLFAQITGNYPLD